MYPFKTFLIGCDSALLSDLRRELSDLSVNVAGDFHDVPTTLAAVADLPPGEPWIFLVKPHSIEDVAQIEHLSDTLAGQPILALIDPTIDPTLLVRAMRAGAAQVVRLPLRSDDFKVAMQRIAIQFGHPPSRTKLISIVGVSEGCGATTIALNLAAEIARLQRIRCCLAEGSISLGRLASYLGIEPRLTMYDLLKEAERLDISQVRNALTQLEEGFLVLTGSYRAITPITFVGSDVMRIINYLRQIAEVVVFDLPYTFSADYFEVLAAAQEIVLVGQQNVSSIHALKLMRDKLAGNGSVATQHVVLSRYDPGLADFSAKRIGKLLDVPEVLTIEEDNNAIQTAENEGKTLFKRYPQCRSLTNIDTLARKLQHLPESPPKKWSLRSVFGRLSRALWS